MYTEGVPAEDDGGCGGGRMEGPWFTHPANGFRLFRPALSPGQNSRAFPQALSHHLATKGETWRGAVKVIDQRGNEGMRVLMVKD